MSVSMLPSAVESILSIERPSGGYLGEMGGSIALTLAFPPNTTQTTYLRPPESRHAIIIFWAQATPTLIPDSLTAHFQHAGHGIYGGNWSAAPIDSGVPGWAVVTDQSPFVATVINTSGLTQRVEMGYFYIVVYSEEDYDLIRQLLKDRVGQGRDRQSVIALIERMEAAR